MGSWRACVTYVLSCNVNQPCVAAVWSFVFQTAKEAVVEGKHSVTADTEINLP